MFKTAFVMELLPGKYEEYVARHRAVWPEISELMSANGISMVIYRHRESLFVFAAAPSEEAWRRADDPEANSRWDAYLADMLKTGEDGRPVMHEMSLAYCFGAFETD